MDRYETGNGTIVIWDRALTDTQTEMIGRGVSPFLVAPEHIIRAEVMPPKAEVSDG